MKKLIVSFCFAVVTAFARDYPGRVVDVYDGDTITVVVDLGLDTIRTEKVRLARMSRGAR